MKLYIYLAALAAIGSIGYWLYDTGYDAGVADEAMEQAEAIEEAVQAAREKFAEEQAQVTAINTATRETINTTEQQADAMAATIAAATLAPAGDTEHENDIVCIDPFGAEYYRLREQIGGDNPADTRTPRPLY